MNFPGNEEYHEQINHIIHFFKPAGRNLRQLFFILIISICVGAASGSAGVLFHKLVELVTNLRIANPYILFLLPLGGIFIVFLYRVTGQYDNKGTNLILSSIQSNDFIPFRVMPLIFISTITTHLFGGSVGSEGAALQIGGSIGETIAIHTKMDDDDKHIIIMCAMSACFSAVFGTPIAAAVFAMEVVNIGMMHYAALIPCVIAAEVASIIAGFFGVHGNFFNIGDIPAFTMITGGKTILVSILFAGISVVFCIFMHLAEHTAKKYFQNPYLRVVAGAALIIILTYLFRSRDYLGAGFPMIYRCFDEGSIPFYAFILKIVFTGITIGCGFRGGEIVPSFFTGATLGCVMGPLLGLPHGLAAACGMAGVFCGVTNCPITSLLIAFELFGFDGALYFILTIAICYMLSGYYGLYSSQKIVYSKYHEKIVNRFTH